MKLAPIIARLETIAALRTIGGALEYAALKNVPGRLPAAFVVPEAMTANESSRAVGAIDQKLSQIFAVVLVFGVGRAGASQAVDAIDALESDVFAALIGWAPPEGWSPVQLIGGALLDIDATAYSWVLRFKTTTHFRKV